MSKSSRVKRGRAKKVELPEITVLDIMQSEWRRPHGGTTRHLIVVGDRTTLCGLEFSRVPHGDWTYEFTYPHCIRCEKKIDQIIDGAT